MSRRSWRQLAELQLDLLLVGLHVLPRLGQVALQIGAADLRLALLEPHLLERALHQRLVAAERAHLLGQLGARRLALARDRADSVVAVEERLLQVGVDPGHGPAQLRGGVLLEPELRGQVLHLALQPLHRLGAALQDLAQEELRQHEHDQQEDDRQHAASTARRRSPARCRRAGGSSRRTRATR